MTKYVFFNLEKEHQFCIDCTWDQACQIMNTSGGQLYCRELKGKKLIVTRGPRAGNEGSEKLTDEMLEQFDIEMEYPLYTKIPEGHYIKAVPQPHYLQIPIGNGFMRIPIGESDDISIIKTMFDELLKIDDVKEIMEKYGVIFHEA